MIGKMLIVDDGTAILFALSSYFAQRGFEVHCAREREEAEALLVHDPFEIVIADLRLTPGHGAEGLEILNLVRDQCPSTRFILMTAHGAEGLEQEIERRGGHALILKPHPLADLERLVCRLLGKDPL